MSLITLKHVKPRVIRHWIMSMAVAVSCLTVMPAMAQQQMHIKITQLPGTHPQDSIYLTGNFNQWNPADENLRLKANQEGVLELIVNLSDVPSDRVEFKFTRGSWQTSECTKEGRLTGPRVAPLGRDTTIHVQIEGWRDDYPKHTLSPQVQVLDSAFYIPQLGKHRKIWIYLPEDYERSARHYPVIYMQDGQHLFDEATSQGRIGPIEWGVDETLDSARQATIIVAINHLDDYADREPEFYFHPNSKHPEVQGQAYLAFIVETLKPYVDSHYRTLPGPAHTAIAGSSLGGLISLYAGLHYPKVFGILGIFSPSLWMDEGNLERDLHTLAHKKSQIHQQAYYFYAGGQENRRKEDGTFVRMQDDVTRVIQLLEKTASPSISYAFNPDGRHGALHWKDAFPIFYKWYSERVFPID